MARIILFLAILVTQATACLWDRDTLAEEASGRADLMKILVGWFDRYPPQYYEMRLERVSEELDGLPERLSLYDDAAVACDRLGRHDEAIVWMKKKKRILNTLPAAATKEHRYRYLANLGTFHAHRWISLPKEKRESDLTPLYSADQFISRALEENPDAHFGREIYQLMAIRWLLDYGDEKATIVPETGLSYAPDGWVDTERLLSSPRALPHIAGISGLISLGAAWESPDAFHSLSKVLSMGGFGSIEILSRNREAELAKRGRKSLHPSAHIREQIVLHPILVPPIDSDSVEKFFRTARDLAEERQEQWIEYQTKRYAKGMHPDTHPNFWSGWEEPPFPQLPGAVEGDTKSLGLKVPKR